MDEYRNKELITTNTDNIRILSDLFIFMTDPDLDLTERVDLVVTEIGWAILMDYNLEFARNEPQILVPSCADKLFEIMIAKIFLRFKISKTVDNWIHKLYEEAREHFPILPDERKIIMFCSDQPDGSLVGSVIRSARTTFSIEPTNLFIDSDRPKIECDNQGNRRIGKYLFSSGSKLICCSDAQLIRPSPGLSKLIEDCLEAYKINGMGIDQKEKLKQILAKKSRGDGGSSNLRDAVCSNKTERFYFGEGRLLETRGEMIFLNPKSIPDPRLISKD